jgi:hypothetical protein
MRASTDRISINAVLDLDDPDCELDRAWMT